MKKFSRLSRSLLLATVLCLLSQRVCRADNRVPCPADPSLQGYVSIYGLNADIQGIAPSPTSNSNASEIVYTLCPDTVLDAVDVTLEPYWNNSAFVCGAAGSSADRCVVKGGSLQVLINARPNMTNLFFQGITFADAEGFSIAAFATGAVTAEFRDCHWVNGTARTASDIGSAIHIVPVAPSPSAKGDDWKGDPLEGRDLQQDQRNDVPAMNVHVFDSSIKNGYGNYRAAFSEGYLYLNNVTVEDNAAALLLNVLGGRLIVENSSFSGNKVEAVIRPITGSSLVVSNTEFSRNEALGAVITMGSEIFLDQCTFLENKTPKGAAVMGYFSNVTIFNSCIVGGIAATPVFVDAGTRLIGTSNNFGEDQEVTRFCADPMGIFSETVPQTCFPGDMCEGDCQKFDAKRCALGDATIAPSTAPVAPETMPPTPSESPVPTSSAHRYKAVLKQWVMLAIVATNAFLFV